MATPAAGVLCFHTRVKCVATRPAFFAFLPINGKRMVPGEEMFIPGDVNALLAKMSPRHRTGFLNAVNTSKTLEVMSTPSQRYFDEGADNTKILTVVNGTVTVADPCEGAYSSSLI